MATLKIVMGIVLMIFGVAAAVTSALLYLGAEADLLTKRPDLENLIPEWGSITRPLVIRRLYKEKLPEGQKIRRFWLWTILGLCSFVLSAILVFIAGD